MPCSAERRLQLEIATLKFDAKFQQQQFKRKRAAYAERAEQAEQAAEQAKHEAKQAQLQAEERAQVAETKALHSTAICKCPTCLKLAMH